MVEGGLRSIANFMFVGLGTCVCVRACVCTCVCCVLQTCAVCVHVYTTVCELTCKVGHTRMRDL